jgi:hypothetical protein
MDDEEAGVAVDVADLDAGHLPAAEAEVQHPEDDQPGPRIR